VGDEGGGGGGGGSSGGGGDGMAGRRLERRLGRLVINHAHHKHKYK